MTLDHEMKVGYLRVLEERFKDGRIGNYPIFPQGKNREGKAFDSLKSIRQETFVAQFHALELAAGLEPVPGRALYGLRRLFTDLTDEFCDDPKVLNIIGGWASGSTVRPSIYQQQRRDRDVGQARSVVLMATDAIVNGRPQVEEQRRMVMARLERATQDSLSQVANLLDHIQDHTQAAPRPSLPGSEKNGEALSA